MMSDEIEDLRDQLHRAKRREVWYLAVIIAWSLFGIMNALPVFVKYWPF